MDRVAANRSSFYVLRELANCYEAFARLEVRMAAKMAAAKTVSRDASQEHWNEARSWYQKSLDVWKEWQARGAGDAPSLERLNAVKRSLSAAEAGHMN